MATGNILAKNDESLALFQNMGNPNYIQIAFGSEDISSVFAKYRTPYKKDGITKKEEMILKDNIPDNPFNDSLWEREGKT